MNRNFIWNGKDWALANGYNHEGAHFGVPVWCQYDHASGEMGCVEAKSPLMEPVISLGVLFTQFCNTFREPGEEFEFAFCIRPIMPLVD